MVTASSHDRNLELMIDGSEWRRKSREAVLNTRIREDDMRVGVTTTGMMSCAAKAETGVKCGALQVIPENGMFTGRRRRHGNSSSQRAGMGMSRCHDCSNIYA